MADGKRVLIVEDDPSVGHVVAAALGDAGMEATQCRSVAERDARLAGERFDLMVTDVGLGEDDGLSTLQAALKLNPDMPVIVISARNTLSTAVRATKSQVFEYLPKPFDIDELVEAARQATVKPTAPGAPAPTPSAPERGKAPALIGNSAAMQEVFRLVAKLVNNDLSVLIQGESGTGKELVAEAIHRMGRRGTGPFVAVNMAAIPSELIESELFGHERGAFTGATEMGIGKFEQAQNGTLFLDEIGDMPMHAQVRLLRVLQSGSVSRVGGRSAIELDTRIIAATNKKLEDRIADGRFREDLYYRLNVVQVDLPPLRDRFSDIPALAAHFVALGEAEGLPVKRIDEAGLAQLARHDWPGNVRELQNTVYRLLVTERDDVLSEDAVRRGLPAGSGGAPERVVPSVQFDEQVAALAAQLLAQEADGTLYRHALHRFEKPLLSAALARSNGNQIRAAKLLGMNRNTLRKKLSELDIDPSSFATGMP